MQRYNDKLRLVLSCFDRILIQRTLQRVGHAGGMTRHLSNSNVRVLHFPRFAEPFTTLVRNHIAQLAESYHTPIQFIAKPSNRKEDIVRTTLCEQGEHPGSVAILSAMQSCPSFRPVHIECVCVYSDIRPAT